LPPQIWLASAAMVVAAVGPIKAAVVRPATISQPKRRASRDRLRVKGVFMVRNPKLVRRDASDK